MASDENDTVKDFPLDKYYKKDKELGSGGFGVVFEYSADVKKIDDYFMDNRNLPKKVAVKQIFK